jgi:hypothetical protein
VLSDLPARDSLRDTHVPQRQGPPRRAPFLAHVNVQG